MPDKNPPRAYDLTKPSEIERLVRECRGYIHTCRRDHHGTDREGRQFAIEALEALADGVWKLSAEHAPAKVSLASLAPTNEQELATARAIFNAKTPGADGRISGSTSYLQREMGIGYNKAARLIEQLEEEQFLTPPDSEGKRRLYAQGIEAAEEE